MVQEFSCRDSVRVVVGLVLLAALVSVVALPTQAQIADAGIASPSDSMATAVPGPLYQAGWMKRLMLGSRYRDLWTTPVEVEVLDLEKTGGGLTPTSTGGGKQTKGLRFVGADGRPYSFRSLDKDPIEIVPVELRSGFVTALVQDQISAAHPTGAEIANRLLDQLDVLHADPRVVILPDSPLLGEYRAEFAGLIGTIEEWPNDGPGDEPGFAGATEVVSTDELQEILVADGRQAIAVEEFLTARLFDVFIGDWDRHRGQWRWANVGAGSPPTWRPIPEDRDQAFAAYDGWFMSGARHVAPQITKFDDSWPPIIGAVWNGRDLDRYFLGGVSEAVWDSLTLFVQGQMTDTVIDDAVRQMPASHFDLRGAEIIEMLQWRRDHLPEIADAYYEHLTHEVDLYGSDASDHFEAAWLEDGGLALTASSDGVVHTSRTFDDDQTNEVRLYLLGGDDVVDISGHRQGYMGIRVISGSGQDRVIDTSENPRTRVYDPRTVGGTVVEGKAPEDRRPYDDMVEPGQVGPPDYSSRKVLLPIAYYSSDLRMLVAVNWSREKYGFRSFPYRHKHTIDVAWSFGRVDGRVSYDYHQRFANSPHSVRASALSSGLETLLFHGFGNDTPGIDDVPGGYDFFRVNEQVLEFQFRYQYDWRRSYFSAGLGAMVSDVNDEKNDLVSQAEPYGSGTWGDISLAADFAHDARDLALFAHRGWLLQLGGSYYPDLGDAVLGDFGEAHGLIAGYATLAGFTLAVRAGGKRIWGAFPFQLGATLGGINSLRGYAKDRFTGDTSVFGSTELRLRLIRLTVLVPGDLGIFGLADAGRVWFEGASDGPVHTSVGGGLWLAPVTVPSALIVAAGASEEGVRLYIGFGFHY